MNKEFFSDWPVALPVIQTLMSVLLLIVFLVLGNLASRLVSKRAKKHDFEVFRIKYIKRALRLGVTVTYLILLAIIWEVSLKGLSVYVASIGTIIGVGLVANWSIVSNITASVILFFYFPFKIGSKVKIMDGDNSVEGEVVALTLFSLRILNADGQEVYYPNNLAIQRSIIDLSTVSAED